MIPEKSVACYRDKQGVCLIIPIARRPTPAAGGVSINRPQMLDASCSLAELGTAIRRATQWCDYSLDTPDAKGPELEATGARSYSEFAKRRIMVSVAFESSIVVTPTARGKKGGYHHLADQSVTLPATVPDEELGDAVAVAFGRCLTDFVPSWEHEI